VITGIESVTLEERDLEQATRELSACVNAIRVPMPSSMYCQGSLSLSADLKTRARLKTGFDPLIFDRMIIRESLYKNMDEIVDDLIGLAENIREKNLKAGEYRETAIERLTEFLFRLSSLQLILHILPYTGKIRTGSPRSTEY